MAENAALTGDFTDPSAFMETQEGTEAEEVKVTADAANDETPDADTDEATSGENTEGETAPTDDAEDDLLDDKVSDGDPVLETLSEDGKRAYDALPEADRNALAADFRIASQGAQLLEMLENPEIGAKVFTELATKLGFSELLRSPEPAAKAAALDASEKTAEDFASDGEWELYQRAQAAERRLEALEKRQQGQDREAKMAAFIDSQFEGTSKEVASRYGDYRISKDMLREAVNKFPSLTPVQAVVARFGDRLYKHGLRVAAEGHKPSSRGPELVKGAGAKGSEIKLTADPTDPKAFMRG